MRGLRAGGSWGQWGSGEVQGELGLQGVGAQGALGSRELQEVMGADTSQAREDSQGSSSAPGLPPASILYLFPGLTIHLLPPSSGLPGGEGGGR